MDLYVYCFSAASHFQNMRIATYITHDYIISNIIVRDEMLFVVG